MSLQSDIGSRGGRGRWSASLPAAGPRPDAGAGLRRAVAAAAARAGRAGAPATMRCAAAMLAAIEHEFVRPGLASRCRPSGRWRATCSCLRGGAGAAPSRHADRDRLRPCRCRPAAGGRAAAGPSPWPVAGAWRWLIGGGLTMATLVLTAVGTRRRRADRRRDRRDPRPADRPAAVRAQGRGRGRGSASWRCRPRPTAAQIPKLFGTMRVAGTVIWATDLMESTLDQRRRQGPAEDGQLQLFGELRGGAVGAADPRRAADLGGRQAAARRRRRLQERDRLPAASRRRGPGGRPADRRGRRGGRRRRPIAALAYAVFEDFQLADYGNRIPSLTFEVEADAGAGRRSARSPRRWRRARSPAGQTPALAGYAAERRQRARRDRGARRRGAAVAGRRRRGAAADAAERRQPVRARRGGARAGGREVVRARRRRERARRGQLAYYDPERDYQTGLQRATAARRRRAAPSGARLPRRCGAAAAKALAERRLAALWAGRVPAKAASRLAPARPAARATASGSPGEAGPVEGRALDAGADGGDAGAGRGAGAAAAGAAGGEPGPAGRPARPAARADLAPPARPAARPTALPSRPLLLVAAAGRKRAGAAPLLSASFDGGASWQAAGATAAPAVIGTALDALPPAGSALFDDARRRRGRAAQRGDVAGEPRATPRWPPAPTSPCSATS